MLFFDRLLPRTRRARKAALTLWIMVAIAVPIWSHLDSSGWDFAVYRAAVHALGLGHDPYADGAAIQIAYHQRIAQHLPVSPDPPYDYVYSPLTLPVLRVIGRLPHAVSRSGFWLLYVLGAFAIVWGGMQAAEDDEVPYFAFVAPVAIFFPGLLENGIILSGNIAYIIYGTALVAAVAGWKTGRWIWFYLLVILASCFKAPLLTLLVIPPLCARKQWLPAGLSAVAGVALFGVQPLLWPTLFRNFLTAVNLQFLYNRDFGSSPSGFFAGLLYDHGLNYSKGSLAFYLLYAIPLLLTLLHLSRKVKRGEIALTRWIPVLLVGVILLNPRIIEYDLAILTIPFALILWRAVPGMLDTARRRAATLAVFVVVNLMAYQSWIAWKSIECCLLVALFATGVRSLVRGSQTEEACESASDGMEHAVEPVGSFGV